MKKRSDNMFDMIKKSQHFLMMPPLKYKTSPPAPLLQEDTNKIREKVGFLARGTEAGHSYLDSSA